MPIPVPIPSGAIAVTSDENDKVESFVAYIAQVLKFGTTGFTISGKNVADPATFPDATNPTTLVAADESTEKQQLYFRQLGVALLKSIGKVYTTFQGVCAAGDAVGDMMYVSGSGKAVAKADAFTAAKMPAVGPIISKPTSTSCIIQVSGIVYDVFSGLTPGQTYFIGAGGTISLVPPSPSVAYSQTIGISIDTDALLIVPSAVTVV